MKRTNQSLERPPSPKRTHVDYYGAAAQLVDKALAKCASERCFPYEVASVLNANGGILDGSGIYDEFEAYADAIKREVAYVLQHGTVRKNPSHGRILLGRDRRKEPFLGTHFDWAGWDWIYIRSLGPQSETRLWSLCKMMRNLNYQYNPWAYFLRERLCAARQRLWIWFITPDLDLNRHVQCGHCLRMLYSELRMSPTEYDDFLWSDTPLPEQHALAYDKQRIVIDDLIDEVVECGDFPPYNRAAMVDAFPIDEEYSICWHYFVSQCGRCHYRVAPAPANSESHCLACYYFQHVLNELMTRLHRKR